MPRSGSGTYNLPSPPSPFVNGTTANAPDVMTVLNDIASAMTDSVAADGQTPMTGALNMNNQSINGANAIAGKSLTLNSVSLPALMLGYLYGMTLSNDGVTPNTVLDIAAGIAVDSTGATFIQLASAFTKNITGAWTAGSGNAGMGQGLTATANTWYHVFVIINNSLPDVYFDTSVTAANAPTGTTAHRRIGSLKLDNSAHFLAFVQVGKDFLWVNGPYGDVTSLAITQTPTLQALGSVPLGIQVQALLYAAYENTAATGGMLVNSPDQASVNGSGIGFLNVVSDVANKVNWEQIHIRTDTSQEVRLVSSQNANNLAFIYTAGWTDYLL